MLRHIRRKGVVRVRRAQQCLYRQQHSPDLQCRRPFICPSSYHDPVYPQHSAPTFQDVQTDASQFIYSRRRALCEHAEKNSATPPLLATRHMDPVCQPTHRYWDGISWSGTVLWVGSWDTPREGIALSETRPLSQRQSVHRAPVERRNSR